MNFYSFSASNMRFTVTASVEIVAKQCNPCHACGCATLDFRVSGHNATVANAQAIWPDIFSCGPAIYAVSEIVCNHIKDARFHGIKKSPINLLGVPKSKAPLQQYFIVEFLKRRYFEIEESPQMLPWLCPLCKRLDNNGFFCAEFYKQKPRSYPIYNMLGKQPASDFFLGQFADQRNVPMCSERVIDLALEKGWSNFEFFDLRGPFGGIKIQHESSNWRNLLGDEIARCEAELRGKNPEAIKVVQGAVLKLPKNTAAPTILASEHPFDNLSAFDGTAWQGNVVLPCAFGLCDFVVYEDEDAEFDVDDNADYLPTKKQRKLFDFFVSHQEALLPLLRDALVKILRQNKILDDANALSNETGFPTLSQWLDGSGPELKNAKRGGSGIVTLYYTVKEADQIIVITVEVACNPARNCIKIKSCET